MLNDENPLPQNSQFLPFSKYSSHIEHLESLTPPQNLDSSMTSITKFQRQPQITELSQTYNSQSPNAQKQHHISMMDVGSNFGKELNQQAQDSQIDDQTTYSDNQPQRSSNVSYSKQQTRISGSKQLAAESTSNIFSSSAEIMTSSPNNNRAEEKTEIDQPDLQNEEDEDENDAQEELDHFDEDQQPPLSTRRQMQTTNQGNPVGGTSLNYQTASFGGIGQIEKHKDGNKSARLNQKGVNEQLYTSMSDIGFANKTAIITKEVIQKMTDASNNWKIRTDTIDEIYQIVQDKIQSEPALVVSQSEILLEFFVQLLSDQNFKIVLTTLMIINKILALVANEQASQGQIINQTLGRYVPQLVKKLGDSKNIIRQEAIRALIGIYDFMRQGDKSQNNFIALILPYVNNSSNWHIREELLNVLIICFLKSRNFYDFDAFQVIESILKLLKDQKERIQLIAMEALITYASIGNKFSVKEIVYQLVEKSTYDFITERMDQDMIPFINSDGALEIPFLDHIEQMSQHNVSAMVPSSVSRRDSMSSNTVARQTITHQQVQSRGNSSGRRVVPPSANSMANYVNQQTKRTVSANHTKFEDDQTAFETHQQQVAEIAAQYMMPNPNFGFLPQLNKANSQQYSNSFYSTNNSLIQGSGVNIKNQIMQLKLGKQNSDNTVPYNQQSLQQQYRHFTTYGNNNNSNFKMGIHPALAGQNEMTFGGLHKGVHSANSIQHAMNHRSQQQVAAIHTSNQTPNPQYFQDEQQIAIKNYSAQKQRQTPYESQVQPLPQHPPNYSFSQQNSRIGARDGVQFTPQRKENGNTFYSDGSFTTATSLNQQQQEKPIGMKSINKRIHAHAIQQDESTRNRIAAQFGPSEEVTPVQKEKSPIIGQIQGRGPIRATRQVVGSANITQNDSLTEKQGLMIDNRGKTKMAKLKNMDIQDVIQQPTLQHQQSINSSQFIDADADATQSSFTKTKASLRKTNFSDLEDNQKYVPTEELEPLSNPEKEFKRCVATLISSEDWSKQFEGCTIIRRICKNHSSVIISQGTQLSGALNNIIKIADSLRSSLSKIALMTINDMFTFLKRIMEPYMESIVKVLLKKASDTNTFINSEAEKALISMCNNCQDQRVLQVILSSNWVNSKSNAMRQKICKCLGTLVKVLGNNVLFFKDNDKLIVQLANYLSDACPEVRNTAKIGLLELSQSIMGQNDLEKLLQRVLNEQHYKKVRDFLDKEPGHLVHPQNNQSDFVITNANQHFQLKKTSSKQTSKGQLRALSLNKSNTIQQAEQPLNIQAKKILKPSQIKKVPGPSNSSTMINKSDIIMIDQFFIDSMKDIILQTQASDWKQRLDSVQTLFDFIDSNIKIFTLPKQSSKLVELSDTLARLITDSNAKIQQLSLEKLQIVLPQIIQFIEQYIITFYQALANNLGSSNVGVKKLTEMIMGKINESVEKSCLVQPLVSMIQFSSNSRLKPLLIDQLIDLIGYLQDQKQSILVKTIQPLALKLLDDNRNDVKLKTEKLLRTLYQQLGQQMIDSCPQVKLQRLCDIVMNSSGGGGTFGAYTMNGVLNIKGQQ